MHDMTRQLASSRPTDLHAWDEAFRRVESYLRAHGIELPALVLSMHDESLYAERVLRAGGRGYIMKYRASVLGAALEVRSGADGAGTTVKCVFRKNL